MTRQLVSWGLALGLLVLAPASLARADELPIRKPGLWEMKVMRAGSPKPDMTMQHCTDATTDREMSTAFAPMSQEICSKKDIQKTATGFVSDSVCGARRGVDLVAFGNRRRLQFRLHRQDQIP